MNAPAQPPSRTPHVAHASACPSSSLPTTGRLKPEQRTPSARPSFLSRHSSFFIRHSSAFVIRHSSFLLPALLLPLSTQAQIPGGPPPQPLPHPELPDIPPVPDEIALWVWLLAGSLAAAFLALILWLLFKPRPPRPPRQTHPRQQTLHALRQLRTLAPTLPPAEVGHRVSALLREYLQSRYHIPAVARTTPELFQHSPAAPAPRLPSQGLLEVHAVPKSAPTAVVTPFAPLAELWDRLAFAPLPAPPPEARDPVESAIKRLEEDPA